MKTEMRKRTAMALLVIGSVLLLLPSAVFAQTGQEARVTGISDGSCLYLHSRPVTGNVDVIGCIPKGEIVTLVAVNEVTGWAEGCWVDTCGYLSYPHLTIIEKLIDAPLAVPLEEKETSTLDSVEKPTAEVSGDPSTTSIDGGICLVAGIVLIFGILVLAVLGNGRKRQLDSDYISGGDGPDYDPDHCRSCGSEFAREGYSDDNGNRYCPDCGEKDAHDDGP